MNNWLKIVLPVADCVLCGGAVTEMAPRETSLFCRACDEELRHHGASCPRCALPLVGHSIRPGEHSRSPSDAPLCGQCQSRPPRYDRAHALFPYHWPLDRLVTRMKFGGRLELARGFGDLLGRHMAALPTRAEALVAVPAHPARLRERGYNQARELARHAARRCGLPLLHRAVIRQRATPAQISLNAATRRRNLRGAFAVPALARQYIAGRRLAIIDDVMTTGSTVDELAGTLKQAGAAGVEIWVVARAPHRE